MPRRRRDLQRPVMPDGVRQLVVFGTARNADRRLRDPDASPHHCALMLMDDGRVFVTDLGSANGTWLRQPGGRSERVLGQVEVKPGDVLTIGRTPIPWIPLEESTP